MRDESEPTESCDVDDARKLYSWFLAAFVAIVVGALAQTLVLSYAATLAIAARLR